MVSFEFLFLEFFCCDGLPTLHDCGCGADVSGTAIDVDRGVNAFAIVNQAFVERVVFADFWEYKVEQFLVFKDFLGRGVVLFEFADKRVIAHVCLEFSRIFILRGLAACGDKLFRADAVFALQVLCDIECHGGTHAVSEQDKRFSLCDLDDAFTKRIEELLEVADKRFAAASSLAGEFDADEIRVFLFESPLAVYACGTSCMVKTEYFFMFRVV